MNRWIPRPRRPSWLSTLLLLASIAGESAHAATPVTGYVVVNPIDVCGTAGPASPTGCAPFNTLARSPNPAQATTTTPIGFVDTATNANVTRAIWLQAGIDITFLPMQEYNNTTYQVINDINCGTGAGSTCSSPLFKQLSTPGAAIPAPGCKSNCTVPLAPTSANAINMFFVNTLTMTTGGSLFGFSWLNGNGVAISNSVFSFSSFVPSRFDTLAHEIGHNLNLDHTTFGLPVTCTGVPSPSGCNLMDAGTIRVIPNSAGCSSTKSGALFDLDTGLCGTSAPAVPQADQLILGASGSFTQEGEAVLSGFINPIPNVNATAGGGDVPFTVAFNGDGRQGEYIVALVLQLPDGFKFGKKPFTQTGGTPKVFDADKLNGNKAQGNPNCLKHEDDEEDDGGPRIRCLEIDFVAGTFTAGTFISFDSDIIDKETGKPATLAQLSCTPPAPRECLELTFVFSDLLATTSAFTGGGGALFASSQTPDAGAPSSIVNPNDFPSVAHLEPPLQLTGFTNIPCTPTFDDTATRAADTIPPPPGCPPLAGGSWLNDQE
jgi:hypothetical protein